MSRRDDRRARFRGLHAEYHLSIARKNRCIAKVMAQVPPATKALRLVDRQRPEIFWIISREVYPAEIRQGEWRASRFDRYGPSSHFNGPDIATIVAALQGAHTSIGLPYASPGELRFDSAR
jgi:hypothetical protein